MRIGAAPAPALAAGAPIAGLAGQARWRNHDCMPINADWHGKHPMPKNPTIEQRIAWHMAHQEHCGCRPIPEKLRELMVERRPTGRARKV